MDLVTVNVTEVVDNVMVNIVDNPVLVTVTVSELGTPGVGLPPGGTTGQVPTKKSGADYDLEWKTPGGGGGGGGSSNLVVSDTDPGLTEPGLWIQTGLGAGGTEMTFWVEDGT